MTDTDLDIDPELDTHLRRTFREVAASVTDAGADDNVIRLVPTLAPRPPRRRWAWLGAAAAAGVVAGAGLMAVADRDPDRADVPAASTTPVVADAMALAEQCYAVADRFITDPPPGHPPQQPLPRPAESTVALFDATPRDGERYVGIFGARSFVVCPVPRGDVPRHTEVSGDLPDVQPPAPDGVRVITYAWVGADSSGRPGSILLLGRAGTDVDRIDVEFSDGSVTAAGVDAGWFLVDSTVPSDVPVGDETLVWTLSNGEVRSAKVTALDTPDPAELCAAEPGCVATELVRLRDAARAGGFHDQAAILADLTVTDAERDDAYERFAGCFNLAGTGAGAVYHGDGQLAIGTSGLDDQDRQLVDNVHALCGAAHLDLVSEAYDLLDAQRRVADG